MSKEKNSGETCYGTMRTEWRNLFLQGHQHKIQMHPRLDFILIYVNDGAQE